VKPMKKKDNVTEEPFTCALTSCCVFLINSIVIPDIRYITANYKISNLISIRPIRENGHKISDMLEEYIGTSF
jgi:hypothetical protein